MEDLNSITTSSSDFTERSVVKFRCSALLKELNCTKTLQLIKEIEQLKKYSSPKHCEKNLGKEQKKSNKRLFLLFLFSCFGGENHYL